MLRQYVSGLLSAIVFLCAPELLASNRPAEVAAKVDRMLAEESEFAQADNKVSIADDALFVRRIYLDLIGRPPTLKEQTKFASDTSQGKRLSLVQQLLAKQEFGKNWGQYWWDVIISRASESRAAIFGRSGKQFLIDEFNNNTPWDDLATSLITAVGDVPENGNTILIFAQEGKSEEIAGEVSRIFMGIQIQCAQCHDHPYDKWKREQFHELAAFFARTGMTRTLQGRNREIYRAEQGKSQSTSSDSGMARRPKTLFGWAVYTLDDPPRRRKKGGGDALKKGEHYMSDLENPDAPGTLVKPVLFATGRKTKIGTGDARRRELLAEAMTRRNNPWFAKAMVNRMWSELVGEGFHEPVDDMGPSRTFTSPQTFDYLAKKFASSGYDVKWLFATITATDAYQRESRVRRNPDEPAFAANCPQPLRANQLAATLASILEPPSSHQEFNRSRGGPRMPGMGGSRRRGLGSEIESTFGFDPSIQREGIYGSIPQALFLMNSPLAGGGVGVASRSPLASLLREHEYDVSVTIELYRKCFSRDPSAAELMICEDYITSTSDSLEAFEDILWALINSPEFRHRR